MPHLRIAAGVVAPSSCLSLQIMFYSGKGSYRFAYYISRRFMPRPARNITKAAMIEDEVRSQDDMEEDDALFPTIMLVIISFRLAFRHSFNRRRGV